MKYSGIVGRSISLFPPADVSATVGDTDHYGLERYGRFEEWSCP